jgi:hypothetical protein
MALESTQPLTEMGSRNISWGVKAAGAYEWHYHLRVPTVLKSGSHNLLEGHAVGQLVEALYYKPEGRGIDSRWCHWKFSLT